MHGKLIPIGSFSPSLNNTANNGTENFDLVSGIILAGIILELIATVTVAVAGPAAVSEAGLGGVISQVDCQDGIKTVLPAGTDGWIFENLCRAEHGFPARKTLAPVGVSTATIRWYSYLPFASRLQLDRMQLATCLPTRKGAKLRISFGPWDGIYLAGSPPTTYNVAAPMLNVYGHEINEPILIQRNATENMRPPQYYYDGMAAYATIATAKHKLPIHPASWLDKAILIHDVDTAAARFLEYGSVRLNIGTTPIDTDIPFNVLQDFQQKREGIPSADLHNGIMILQKNDQGRGTGLPKVSETESSVEVQQMAATTRRRLVAFKMLEDISVTGLGKTREGGTVE